MVEAAQNAVPAVPLKDAHDRLAAGEEIIILDVREPDEWTQGHIEGATLLAPRAHGKAASKNWRRTRAPVSLPIEGAPVELPWQGRHLSRWATPTWPTWNPASAAGRRNTPS